MTKYIVLPRGFITIVDDADYEYLQSLGSGNWSVTGSSSGEYNYARKQIDGEVEYLHRLIMKPPKGFVVDHINGDTMNNTRANLRICTQRQNSVNQKKRINVSSVYKGVSCSRPRASKPWEVKLAGVRIGYYANEEEAARAYDAKAKDVYGEFAKLNFPD